MQDSSIHHTSSPPSCTTAYSFGVFNWAAGEYCIEPTTRTVCATLCRTCVGVSKQMLPCVGSCRQENRFVLSVLTTLRIVIGLTLPHTHVVLLRFGVTQQLLQCCVTSQEASLFELLISTLQTKYERPFDRTRPCEELAWIKNNNDEMKKPLHISQSHNSLLLMRLVRGIGDVLATSASGKSPRIKFGRGTTQVRRGKWLEGRTLFFSRSFVYFFFL